MIEGGKRMGGGSFDKDRRVQGGEQEEIQADKLLAEAKDYLGRFGLTCVFESTSADDLRSVWGSDLGMPPELYPLIVKLAEEEVAEMQKGLDEDYENEDDYKELETQEERDEYVNELKRLKALSPKDFWMWFNGSKAYWDKKNP